MGHVNETQLSRTPIHESSLFHSNPDFNPFKKPRLPEKTKYSGPRIPISVNRSKLSIPFRSQLCILFQKGKCYYNENCHFAHSLSDLRKPGLDSVSTDGNLNEGSKRNGVPVCFEFLSGKPCSYGDRCRYLHVCDGNGRRENSGMSVLNGGRQNNGESCRNMHIKTRLCHRWERFGFCSNGGKCTYAHGKSELRNLVYITKQQNRNSSELKVLASNINHASSSETGINTANKQQLQRKRCFMKWDAAKIGRIYGDWVDDGHDLQVSLSKVGS